MLLAALLLSGLHGTQVFAVGVGGSGMYQWSVELRGYT